MDQKKLMKTIIEETKKGKFKEVLKLLQENEINQEDFAIKIVISCSTACYNATTLEKISSNDLSQLLHLVVPTISHLEEISVLHYFQSIFHIVKLLIKKEDLNIIAKMEPILLPHFIPEVLLENQKNVYHNICKLLFNMIQGLSNTANTKYNDWLIKICIVMSSMADKIIEANKVLEMSYNCAQCLEILNFEVNEQEKFYFFVLNLIKNRISSIDKEIYKLLIKYLFFMLNKYLKLYDFQKGEKFFEKSRIIFKEEEVIHMHEHLGLCLIVSPLSMPDKINRLDKWDKYLSYLRNCNSSTILYEITSYSLILIHTIFSYYAEVNGKLWEDIPEDMRLIMLRCILKLCDLLAQTKVKEECTCKCNVGTNIFESLKQALMVPYLIYESIKNNKNVSKEYYLKTIKLLYYFSNKIETFEQAGCDKWKTAWKNFARYPYNMGCTLYNSNNEASEQYFAFFLKYSLKFKEIEDGLIKHSFNAMCNLMYKKKDFHGCMVFTALYIFICPEQRNKAFTNFWIMSKVKERDSETPEKDDLQQVTLVSVFEKFPKYLEHIIKINDHLSKQDKVELLIFELEQYKLKWKSREPIMAAFTQLYNIADIKTTVEVIKNIFGDCNFTIHNEVSKLFPKILKQFKTEVNNNNDPQSKINLAFLYFLHYKYCAKNAVIKNSDDMEKSMMMTKDVDKPIDPIPKDINDECDIVSSYENLKLDKYFDVIKYLNKALFFIQSVDSKLQPSDIKTMFKLLISIAFEYRLHSFSLQSLHAFHLALKLVEIEDDKEKMLLCISFIIENADVTKKHVKRFITKADKITKELETNPDSTEKIKTLLTYYICKTKAFLYNDYKFAYNVYKIANNMFEQQKDNKEEFSLIQAQLLVLKFKFHLLPCRYQIEDHAETTALMGIQKANEIVIDSFQGSKATPYEISTFFDVNLELTKIYHLMRLPREVRCFSRETVVLAQKMVLPLRCTMYLIYLANSDMLSSRFDDCNVKLNGISDILCLTKHNEVLFIDTRKQLELPEIKDDPEIIGLTNNIQELMLDLPIHRRQFSPSSPSLTVDSFKLPCFLSHESSCECFYCNCLEYHEFLLMKTRLDALLNIYQKNIKLAQEFFNGALNLYKCFQRNYSSYKLKTKNIFIEDFVPDINDMFMESYGYILLDYSSHLMRQNNKTEAIKINNDLIKLMQSKKIQYIYLYQEALMQRLGYMTSDQFNIENPANGDKGDLLNVPKNIKLSRTPDSKQSTVIVSINEPDSDFTPPKRKIKKCMPLNLSPSNEDCSSVVKKGLSKVAKTKPKKILIFNDGAKSKKKTMFDLSPENKTIDVSIASTEKKNTLKENIKHSCVKLDVPDSSNMIFASPEPNKTNYKSAVGGLRSRTKLLTEKLKQSGKDTVENDVKYERKTRSARKNLLNELSDNDQSNSKNTGAIKKSIRKK